MEVRVLGPVDLREADKSIYLPRRQHRLILGVLALHANHQITCDRLIDLIWGTDPPRRARAVIHSRVSELRGALTRLGGSRKDRLLTHGDGYVLQIQPERVDAHRFLDLLSHARATPSDEQARLTLREALGLWRGQALGGWLPADAHAALCHSLESAQLTATEELYEVELRLGNHSTIVDEMLAVVESHPGRERLTAQAMRALHRSGRTAEATQVYDRCRRWLAEELGLDPAKELQEANLAIIGGHGTLTAASSRLPPPGLTEGDGKPAGLAGTSLSESLEEFRAATPRTLPADTPDFTGRIVEAACLSKLLTVQRTTVVVVAVSGPAGVGKTALCLHVANRLGDEFPDGQLFADLHGFDHDRPASAFEVIGRFLRALGVDGLALPSTLDDRTDLYRGLLARRQVLIILDNAGTAEQVLPLVPGGDRCAVLVTSRTRLGAELNARSINLDVLDSAHAEELLARIAGPERVTSEPDATAEVASLCGYLPLALRVVGAKLSSKPHWSVAHLVHRMLDERQRLNHLKHGHLDVRASITVSYSGMSSEARYLLRRLGNLGLPDVNVWSSAALLDKHPAEAEEALEQLHDAQLLDVVGLDATGYPRYRFHDLVRLFAREVAQKEETPAALAEARARAYGSWLGAVDTAYRNSQAGDFLPPRRVAPRWRGSQQVIDALVSDPITWFETDRLSIGAIVGRAAEEKQSSVCADLATNTYPLFQMRRYFDELREILELAREVASHQADDAGLAAVLVRLGSAEIDRQRFAEAIELFNQATELFLKSGDQHGAACSSAFLAMVDRYQGKLDKTVESRYLSILAPIRQAENYTAEAMVLRALGQIRMDDGDEGAAESFFTAALEICQRRRLERIGAQVMFWRGMLRLAQDRPAEAEDMFLHVLRTCRRLGDRPGQAQALRGLGLAHHNQGNSFRAVSYLDEALSLVRQPRPTLMEGWIRQALRTVEGTPSG